MRRWAIPITYSYNQGGGLYAAAAAAAAEAMRDNLKIGLAREGQQADVMRALAANSAAYQEGADRADERVSRGLIAGAEMQGQSDRETARMDYQTSRDARASAERLALLDHRFDRRSELEDQAAENRGGLLEQRYTMQQRRELEGLAAQENALNQLADQFSNHPAGASMLQQWRANIMQRRGAIRPMSLPTLPPGMMGDPAGQEGGGAGGVPMGPGGRPQIPPGFREGPFPGEFTDEHGSVWRFDRNGQRERVSQGTRDVTPSEFQRQYNDAVRVLTGPEGGAPSPERIRAYIDQQNRMLEDIQNERRAPAGVSRFRATLSREIQENRPAVTMTAPEYEALREMDRLTQGGRTGEQMNEQERRAFLDAAARLPEAVARRIQLPENFFGRPRPAGDRGQQTVPPVTKPEVARPEAARPEVDILNIDPGFWDDDRRGPAAPAPAPAPAPAAPAVPPMIRVGPRQELRAAPTANDINRALDYLISQGRPTPIGINRRDISTRAQAQAYWDSLSPERRLMLLQDARSWDPGRVEATP